MRARLSQLGSACRRSAHVVGLQRPSPLDPERVAERALEAAAATRLGGGLAEAELRCVVAGLCAEHGRHLTISLAARAGPLQSA